MAIVDDIGAVAIIALVYSAGLDATAGRSARRRCSLVLLGAQPARACARSRPYLLLAVLLWLAVLRSGVHATVAGVLLALLS